MILIRLAMAQIMAKAAKVPASPWPLMMGVVYEAGSNPAIPNRLPCSTAPNAVHKQTQKTNKQTGQQAKINKQTKTNKQKDSQLMMTIFTMVTEKKGSGSRGTLTRVAVTMKTNMMISRLPITRRRWEILTQEEEAQAESSVGYMKKKGSSLLSLTNWTRIRAVTSNTEREAVQTAAGIKQRMWRIKSWNRDRNCCW